MDFGGLLVVGIVWLLFNLISQGKGKPRTTARPMPQPRSTGAPDPSQREGSRLERLLRELERNLEDAAGRPARLPAPPPSEDEDVEERDSLEKPEQVVSLETEVSRRNRPVYDQDSEAEAIVQRRIDSARARDRALDKSDHKAFDAKVRQEVADHTAVRRYTPEQLRDAVVWREILGPPVSER